MKTRLSFVAAAAFFLVSAVACTAITSTVKLASGTVQGNSRDANGILSFKGLPFAKPPVGSLRWTSPVSPDPWTNTLNATTFGFSCWNNLANGPVYTPYNEDCLTVNVWSGATQITEKRPVMVWIYGGGFQFGASANPLYDGTALAQKGVIIVSFNYRLGVFGFLGLTELDNQAASSGGHNSGDFGLQDQLAVLHWVQQNIAAFGGDPHNVTLWGQSAGAHSVGLLMSSPLSPGLFGKAIMESGAYWDRNHGPLTTFAEARQYGLNFEKKLGVTSVAGLRSLSAETINNAQPYNLNQDPGVTGFAPSIDGFVLPTAPGTIFHNGKQLKIPLLAGFNEDEEFLFLGLQLPHNTSAQFESAAQVLFGSEVPEFVSLYPDNTAALLNLSSSQFVGDLIIRDQTWDAADTQHQTSSPPVWVYYYNYTSPYLPVAAHTAEEYFVFGNLIFSPIFGPQQPPSAQDRAFSAQLMAYWTNFAKTGNPNGVNLPTWPAYGSGAADFQQLSSNTAPLNYNLSRLRFISSFRQNGEYPMIWRAVAQE